MNFYRLVFSVLLFFFAMVFVLATDQGALAENETLDSQKPHLREIIVTSSRLANTFPGYSLLLKEDIFSSRLPLETLKTTTGLSLMRYGASAGIASVMIQGANSDHTLVILDGLSLKSPLYGSVDYNNLSFHGLNNINIYRGDLSAIYGSGAIGGVLQLQRQAIKQGLQFKLSYGSEDYQGLNLEYGIKDKSLDYSLAIHRIRSRDDRYPSYFLSEAYLARLEFLLTDSIQMKFLANNYWSQRANPLSRIYPYPSSQEDSGWQIQASLGFFGENQNSSLSFDQKFEAFRGLKGLNNRYWARSRRLGFDQENTWLSDHNLLWGLTYEKIDYQNEFILDHKNFDNLALYFNELYQRDKNWEFGFGLRQDHYSRQNSVLTGKASFNYQFLLNNYFKGSWGTAFNAPTISDLYYYSESENWGYTSIMSGNPQLKPEFSRNLGLEYSWQATPSQNLRLGYFQKDIEQLHNWNLYELSVTKSIYLVENMEQAKIRGLELEMNLKINENWTGKFNNIYFFEAVDLASGHYLAYRPKWINNWEIAYEKKDFKLSAIIHQVSARPSLKKVSHPLSGDLPTYGTMDLIFDWSHWQLQITNIFDVYYEEILGYAMPKRGFLLIFSL